MTISTITILLGLLLPIPVNAAEVPLTPTVIINLSIEDKVRLVFIDDPIMPKKIKCESRFKQFWPDGTPKISPTSDVGIMQINIQHWKEAKSLGLDIFNSVDDNIKMGRIIYDRQGSGAWLAPSTPDCKPLTKT